MNHKRKSDTTLPPMVKSRIPTGDRFLKQRRVLAVEGSRAREGTGTRLLTIAAPRCYDMRSVTNGYPILLDVADCRVLIFGGGVVAMRKVRGLVEAGAKNVTVISPAFHEQFPSDVIRLTGKFDPQQLAAAQLVFAATNNPEVNAAIVAACEQLDIWVNRADAADDHPGNFASLASRRVGPLLVGVSAGGNPAISAAIRDELADHVQPHWATWIAAVSDLRALILEEIAPGERALLLKALASPEASDAVAKGGEPALRLWFNLKFGGVLR